MRLHLLVRAGGVQLALPADRVKRVGGSLIGGLSVAGALGRRAEPRSGVAVEVIDADRALVVDRVDGAVDSAGAQFASLPSGARLPRPVLRRALIRGEDIHFELDPDELLRLGAGPHALPVVPLEPASLAPPAQALVFRCDERTLCAPFSLVQAVLHRPRIFDVPLTPVSHLGVLLHGGALLSVFDPAALLELRLPAKGPYVVLVEAAGQPIGLIADELRGVLAYLQRAAGPSERGGAWMVGRSGESIFLPDYDRLFAGGSAATAGGRP